MTQLPAPCDDDALSPPKPDPKLPGRIPFVVGGITVQFTPQQRTLLYHMLLRPGRIHTNRELLTALDTKAEYKLIDVLVCRINATLRAAFSPHPPSIQINAHWGLGHSLTYGHPTAPVSSIRWTLNRKREFLHRVRGYRTLLRHHMSPENDVGPNPITDEEAVEAERILLRLRADHPEVTDTMLDEWSAFGPSVVKVL